MKWRSALAIHCTARSVGSGSGLEVAIRGGGSIRYFLEHAAGRGAPAALDTGFLIYRWGVVPFLLQGAGRADTESGAAMVLGTILGLDKNHVTTSE